MEESDVEKIRGFISLVEEFVRLAEEELGWREFYYSAPEFWIAYQRVCAGVGVVPGARTGSSCLPDLNMIPRMRDIHDLRDPA